jgi:hypothetical protein
MFDWKSFWINVISGGIFFILSTLVAIWIIPRITIKLINKQRESNFQFRITFLIEAICNYFNDMPDEFKVNDLHSTFYGKYIKNSKSPTIVGLNPNLFIPRAFEDTMSLMTKVISNYLPEQKHELILKEYDRLKDLKLKLEYFIQLHSYNIDEKIVEQISVLCFNIGKIPESFKFYEELEKLIGNPNHDSLNWGAYDLIDLYERLFTLLNDILKFAGFNIVNRDAFGDP